MREALYAKLKARLPASLQDKVKEVHLRGLKVHKFRIDVAPPFANEISWGFSDFLKEEEFQRNGVTLFARPQLDPISEKMFACAGKAKAFLSTKCSGGASATCTTSPHWTLKVSNETQTVTVGKVNVHGSIDWDVDGCRALSITTTEMASAFASFRG